jgi:esterase/lipase superfamily enzyme
MSTPPNNARPPEMMVRIPKITATMAANQVVLAAPDIDIDLFTRQIETIGPLARPIIVLNSTDDWALAISRRIGGFRVRMGSIGEDNAVVQEMIAKKAIRVIDLSMLPALDRANHNRFIKLAEILSRSERRRKTLLENGLDDALVHDSEKWEPVFGQDHAQTIR